MTENVVEGVGSFFVETVGKERGGASVLMIGFYLEVWLTVNALHLEGVVV